MNIAVPWQWLEKIRFIDSGLVRTLVGPFGHMPIVRVILVLEQTFVPLQFHGLICQGFITQLDGLLSLGNEVVCTCCHLAKQVGEPRRSRHYHRLCKSDLGFSFSWDWQPEIPMETPRLNQLPGSAISVLPSPQIISSKIFSRQTFFTKSFGSAPFIMYGCWPLSWKTDNNPSGKIRVTFIFFLSAAYTYKGHSSSILS